MNRRRWILAVVGLLSGAAVASAQTNVRAWHAAGQTWVVWEEGPLPPLTYEIYRAPSLVTDVSQATRTGRISQPEWEGERLKIGNPTWEWTIPDGGGGTYTLQANEGVFVYTPHVAAQEYFFVVPESTNAIGVQQSSPLVVETVSETPTCHLQIDDFVDSHPRQVWCVWADGRVNDNDALPGFPVLANASKMGAPHVFAVYSPIGGAGAGLNPVVLTFHGGDGTWRQMRPDGPAYENIGLTMTQGLVLAHDDAVYRLTTTTYDTYRTGWLGYPRDMDPFLPTPMAPPPAGSIVVLYTQRRIEWVNDWLVSRSTYSVDPHRVAAIGYSMGSRGAHFSGRLHPERYSSVTSLCVEFHAEGGPTPMVGDEALNLETNEMGPGGTPLHVNDFYLPATRLSAQRDVPLIRYYIGRREASDPWTPARVAAYVAANDAAWGMHFYWDQRDHGTQDWSVQNGGPSPPNKSNVGEWIVPPAPIAPGRTERASAEYQTRFRNDESYPGFYDDDQDPNTPSRQPDIGTGDPCDGDPWGTWSGYTDWDQATILDEADTWACTIFMTGLSSVAVDNALVDTATTSVTLRRTQRFLPSPGALLSWELRELATSAVLQSGTINAEAEGLVRITGLTIRRDPNRSRLVVSIRPCDCGRGNVDTGAGGSGPVDVLLINGSAGTDCFRVVLGPNDPTTLDVTEPPSRIGLGARYWMGAWIGGPLPSTVRLLPASLGPICMPMRLTGGAPQPRFIANVIPGTNAQLGASNWPGPAPRPAPHRLLNLPMGTRRPGANVYFQGIVRDDRSSGNQPYSVTNGIALQISP